MKETRLGWVRKMVVLILGITQVTLPLPALAAWCDHLSNISVDEVAHIDRLAGMVVNVEPNAMLSIKMEGMLPGQKIYDSSDRASRDFGKARTLAYGWSVTKKNAYLVAAKNIVMAWAKIYRPSGNPIDETNFSYLFEAYALIRSEVGAEERESADEWIAGFYRLYLEKLRNRKLERVVQSNNWQSHRIKIVAAAASAVGDAASLAELESYFHEQVRANIRNDGSVEDFHERDALSYAVYSLQALVDASLMASSGGVNWYRVHPVSKKLITSAIHWLDPYVDGRKLHVEFAHSKVDFDRVRARAGVKGHESVIWDPSRAKDLYWSASYIDPEFEVLARRLTKQAPLYLSACRGVR